jgi:hypothetical protein
LFAIGACNRSPHAASSASPATAFGTPLPQGVPVFAGSPPARLVLDARPLDVDPDGAARWLVRAHFVDKRGRPTELLGGGDVAFAPSRGSAQWQTRLRFGAPAAIVSTVDDGPLAVRVTAEVGTRVAPVRIATDTRSWRVARVVARALGPHELVVGWFPRVTTGAVGVSRGDGDAGTLSRLATVAAPCSSFRDPNVAPGASYRYEIVLPRGTRAILRVPVPPEPRHGDLAAIGGKGMWLSFSPSTLDADGYDRLVPADIVARAIAAGLHAIDLRTTYGPFQEITPAAKPAIDALIDAAAAHGIAIVGWTVPRSTSFEDLAAEVAAARYTTPNGNGLTALAVDLERGDFYLGSGAAGYAALGAYLRMLRAALGPGYPLIATVEDPYLENLDRASYPYDAIAASADALQPMVYWRMLSRHAVGAQAVRAALRGSYAATLREAGRGLPIDLGLQSSAEGPRGAPPPDEVAASIVEARALGALGVTFFDWSGTPPAGWQALAQTPW